MKRLILLSLLPLLLGACTPISSENTTDLENGNNTQETSGNTETGGNSQGEETQTGGNTETGGQEETGGNVIHEGEHHLDNQPINLDEFVTYQFHNGHKPAWNDEWDFYYGTSNKPVRSCFYECPNESLDYSGIKFFDKKEYLISPNFESYPKVEVRFQFWFSAVSDKAETNKAQFYIEEFNSSNTQINTDKIELTKSIVPNDNTAYEKTVYITQSTMTSFILRFNNLIPNGQAAYMPVLCQIKLKGWQYA